MITSNTLGILTTTAQREAWRSVPRSVSLGPVQYLSQPPTKVAFRLDIERSLDQYPNTAKRAFTRLITGLFGIAPRAAGASVALTQAKRQPCGQTDGDASNPIFGPAA